MDVRVVLTVGELMADLKAGSSDTTKATMRVSLTVDWSAVPMVVLSVAQTVDQSDQQTLVSGWAEQMARWTARLLAEKLT